ncbi:outer membrane protein [Bradyrhizobium sp.]|uniref:outer membrane protein n=1 Tax=Bradyrhizobium sp. TaxID=376 RepID=UPI002BA59E53|nr:outer membrane beta-barrel protein [Bradyrhizobium sp.]HMM91332.1 outer membrane beta-barrel protein [Bradyrhizobium sp.]
MKKILLMTTGLIALGIVPAAAADLAARPYTKAPVAVALYDWSGFYIGANGGWGTSHNCLTNTAIFGVPVTPTSEGCHDADGGTVGGQIGYRWQAGNWVFGVEAQGNWADFNGSNIVVPFAENRTKIDAFGLFTGQVGYAANNVLFYVKGGAAVTNSRHEGVIASIVIDRAEHTRWGGAVGAGVEYAFAPNWSFGVEYNHLFMGTENSNFSGVGLLAGVNTRNEDIKQDADIVTARINYRFGGPAVARY